MDRQRGLILEMQRDLAVVLTPGGQFKRVPAQPGWKLGDEVALAPATLRPVVSSSRVGKRARPRLSPAWLAAAAVLLALLLPGAVSVQALFGQPSLAAYVAVDINPSFELRVSSAGKVLAAEALNDDATPLLEQGALEGLPLADAVGQLTERAVTAGYLSAAKENLVLITVTPSASDRQVSDRVLTQIEASSRAAADVLSVHSLTNPVATLTASPEVRDIARSEGLSTGKLLVASELADEGVEVSREELKQEPLAQIVKKADKDSQAGVAGVVAKVKEKAKDEKGREERVQSVNRFVQSMQEREKMSPPGKQKDDDKQTSSAQPSPADGRQSGPSGAPAPEVAPADQAKESETAKPAESSDEKSGKNSDKDGKDKERKVSSGRPDVSWQDQLLRLLDRIFGPEAKQKGNRKRSL